MKKKTKRASRNDQVVRILHLLRDLERLGGCDLYELATHYGTTTRTIRRDLEALEEAGIPLKKEPGEGSKVRWALDTAATSKITNLIETTRRQGFAFSSGVILPDSVGIAVPIRMSEERPIGSLTLTIPLSRFVKSKLKAYVALLSEEARSLSTAQIS